MVESELRNLISQIQSRQCEEQTTEVKAAHRGCPEKLYDTISAFANQNSGGVLVFGLDESNDFQKVGVYDAQDLQNKIVEYCEQMTPIVRPVLTVYDEDGLVFVSAEIPPLEITERPCFKTAKGRLAGSYIRVGQGDKPMTEYEVYSYEAFRKKYRDDLRPAEGVAMNALDPSKVDEYLLKKRSQRPNLAQLSSEQQYELAGIIRDGKITMAALLLFGIYPQAYYPQLSIIAMYVPGTTLGAMDANGNRFLDSKHIEGTLPDMLDGALSFVKNNMRVATKIDAKTGLRTDEPQYPMDAVREAILNALVHRDYSIHTENMPIQLIMFYDRIEIVNQGGLYGRTSLDQLGNLQPDTRNPMLVTAMETLGKTENRYSGIPTIRAAMSRMGLPEPQFLNARGTFTVRLYNKTAVSDTQSCVKPAKDASEVKDEKGLIDFCQTERSRKEIIQFLGISSGQYAMHHYLAPLLSSGAIRMTKPDKPRSPEQRYISVKANS